MRSAGAGQRQAATGHGSKASQAFVRSFTKKYAELADRSPVYAELRNLIDLAIAAAYIQQEGYVDKAGWKMEFFGSEKAFSVETYEIPKTVESAVNVITKGQRGELPRRRRRNDPPHPGTGIREPPAR